MSKELISHTLENMNDLFKKVVRMTITLNKSEVKRHGWASKTIYRDKLVYGYEYVFDTVTIEKGELIAKGREIILFDIEDGYTLTNVSFYTLSEDKEYECVYSKLLELYYPSGGTFTFEGSVTLSVSHV